MAQHEVGYIIRTHDRIAFLDCRQAWDFGSKIRQNYEPNRGSLNMDFGTAIHRGLETRYDPKLWTAPSIVRTPLMLEHFRGQWKTYKPQYEFEPDIWHDHNALGIKMLERYDEWAVEADAGYEPLYVEIEFEVPILASPELAEEINAYALDSLYVQFKAKNLGDGRYHLHCRKGESEEWIPVYYQGRVDTLWRDKYGFLWIVDHKTTGQFGNTNHLEMDEQTGSYCWALQVMLDLPIRGVIYNELLKSYPEPPKQNKPTKKEPIVFSQDKRQNTTAKIYEETLAEHGVSMVGYLDFLSWLRENERPYFRRTEVHRSQRELQLLGERICVEAIDMLNNPRIYPHPRPGWNGCDGCFFRAPCLAKMDGSDPEFLLSEDFHVRS